jgi:hypothetical protein
MTAGATFPAKSVISIPMNYNKGNAPIMVPVNFPLPI